MRRGFVILVAMLTLLTGCVAKEPVKTNPDVGGPPLRFTVEYIESGSIGNDFYILTDTETGREYLYISGTQGRGGIVELRGEE